MVLRMWLQVAVAIILCSVEHASAQACGVPTAMTEEEQREMVHLHNEERSIDGANEFALEWDENLAARAQEFAEVCAGGHGMLTDCDGHLVGQNGYYAHTAFIVRNAFRAWLREKANWNMSDAACMPGKVCGHWTQIAWAKTRLIGCGYATCPNHTLFPLHVYCDYYPPGNYPGAPPFTTGPPCVSCHDQTFGSATKPGYKCVDNLCVACNPADDSDCLCGPDSQCTHGTLNHGTCRCDCPADWYGLRCQNRCKDTIWAYACNYFKVLGFCDRKSVYGRYVLSHCPITCGLC